jgi:membrane protein
MIRKTAGEWIEQDILRLGAAFSFYALFSVPPLVVIVLAISGFWFGEDAARCAVGVARRSDWSHHHRIAV